MVLMIYNDQICKEILMPNLFNTDYQVRLSAREYSLRADIVLQLERGGRDWTLISTADYWINEKGEKAVSHTISKDDLINIDTLSGEHLVIIASDDEINFHVMEKYDLTHLHEVTIGRTPENMVVYSFMSLISSCHAVLRREGRGWVLTDCSRNGIYCRNNRIRGKHIMQQGVPVTLFGLQIMIIGNILMIGANCGELHVSEDMPLLDIEPYTPDPASVRPEAEISYFNRAPRNLPVLYTDDVEIDAPPPPNKQERKPAYMVIGPAFSMAIPMSLGCLISIYASQMSGRSSGVFMYTGLITAFGSAMIGGLWAVLNLNYETKKASQDEIIRFNAYSNYLIQIAEKIRNMYLHNTRAMNRMYPPAAECLRYANGSAELWNRNPSHDDFLYQRLGLGDSPFQVPINVPKEKFTLVNDTLQDKPQSIKDEFSTLHQVPIGINVRENQLIGLIGGKKRSGAYDLMRVLTASIAACHSYTDVKLVYIFDEENRDHLEDWECMRWLPHVWSEDKSIRFMAGNELEYRDIFFHLANVLRNREEYSKEGVIPKPYYVIFIENSACLEGEMLSKYIYHPRPEYGMTTFLMVESLSQLPNSCEMVIENDSYNHAVYNLMEVNRTKMQIFTPDAVSVSALETFGKSLANIQVEETEEGTEIPNAISFMEMYKADSMKDLFVFERWRKNRTYNSMRVPVGVKAGGNLCYLDIHEKFHGPHGLVAGTTGSGKSETLQTYILSLAVNFSPEDVSFFIIDFKGGGMANLFSGIPHLAGLISNLSGNQVRRAMISIKSENLRRQRIFADNGVNNINLYTKLYKNHEADKPIPHLFIIIDEFAELKREEPEFMQELISVAQVGRSLGVHLILATQKPSGTVDDNIWSNSKFKLCLRVQDRQDSMDMLHKADAAFLTQAGRCYLQVGNDEIYELFQSGFSGAPYREGGERTSSAAALISRSGKTDLVGVRKRGGEKNVPANKGKEETQLDAVIDYLTKCTEQGGYQRSGQLWLPVLKDHIYLEELNGLSNNWKTNYKPSEIGKRWFLEVTVGMYDDPEEQAQRPLVLKFPDCGHIAVCGTVVSGKSTFMQTMIYGLINKYSPDEVQMYMLDFSSHLLSCFENAPHVGGVVSDNQEDRLDKFFNLLTDILNERRNALQGGNYTQYVQAFGVKLPAICVFIDNFAAFKTKCGDKYDEILQRLTREGVGYGVFLIVSAQGFSIAEIPARLGDSIRTVISLEQQDKFKYMDVLRRSRIEILPEAGVKGRGLVAVGDKTLEFQTALSIEAEDDFARGQALKKFSEDLREQWPGKYARKIPNIPEKPTLSMLTQEDGYDSIIKSVLFCPLGYRQRDAALIGIPMRTSYCSVVTGRARSGKTNTLKIWIEAAGRIGAQIVIVEKLNGDFSTFQNEITKWNGQLISDDKGLFKFFEGLVPEFKRRNLMKRQFIEEGLDEAAIGEKMSHEQPICIFIDNLADLINMVYRPSVGISPMSGFFENIIEKGKLHNIYFIAGLKMEEESLLMGYKGYNLFVADKSGVHLGGNLSSQKIFGFQNIPFSEANKSLKKGFGHISTEEDEGEAIVIPSVK